MKTNYCELVGKECYFKTKFYEFEEKLKSHNSEYLQCCGTCLNLADSINGLICTKWNHQILRNQTCKEWVSLFSVCKRQQIS